MTIKSIGSGSIRLKWSNRVTCYPVKVGAQNSNYDIICPLENTVGMVVNANADGILINYYSTLWYILPIANTNSNSQPDNFRLLAYNSTEAPQPNWILLATTYNDPGVSTLKWLPEQITLPIPDDGKQIMWETIIIK